jgi:hypothetical protein
MSGPHSISRRKSRMTGPSILYSGTPSGATSPCGSRSARISEATMRPWWTRWQKYSPPSDGKLCAKSRAPSSHRVPDSPWSLQQYTYPLMVCRQPGQGFVCPLCTSTLVPQWGHLIQFEEPPLAAFPQRGQALFSPPYISNLCPQSHVTQAIFVSNQLTVRGVP